MVDVGVSRGLRRLSSIETFKKEEEEEERREKKGTTTVPDTPLPNLSCITLAWCWKMRALVEYPSA
jgi:hypothetical protein